MLRLNTGAFDAALMNSSSRWTKFTAALKAGAFIAAEAFGAIVVGSVLAATNFQKHMTEALAIMGEDGKKWRTEMETAARAVAKTTLFSASQAADGFYYLASAGYTAQQSIALLPKVAEFAQAGLVDLSTATEYLTQIQSALGLKTNDVAQNFTNLSRISDVLTQAANESQATLEQFASALTNKAGPTLRAFGKSVEEGVAVLAAFADQGIVGAKAGTALSIVLRELGTKAIKNADAFKQFHISVFDANGKMRDMADIVSDLENALAGMSDKQKRVTLTQLGFTDRSLAFILALLGESNAIRKYEKDLNNATGATSRVAIAQLDSVSAAFTLLGHMVSDVGIEIGNRLLPGIKNAMLALRGWLDANEALIASLVVGVVGAVGTAAKFIFSVLGPAFAFVGDKIKIVAGYISDFSAAWKEVFGGGATASGTGISGKMKGLLDAIMPIGDPLYGLTVKMKGLLGVIDEAGPKMNPFIGMLQALADKFSVVSGIMGPVVDWLQQYNIVGLILAGTLTAILGGALVALAAWLLPFVVISAAVVAATAGITVAWSAWGDQITQGVGKALEWISTNIIPTVADVITWFTKDILPGIIAGFQDVAAWLGSVWPTVVKAAGDLFTWLHDNVIVPVGQGIKWFADNVLPHLAEAFNGVVSWVSEHWPTISSIIGQVLGAVGTAFVIIRNVIAAVVPVIWAIIEPIGKVLLPAIGFAAGVLLTAIDLAFKAIGAVWQGTSDAVTLLWTTISTVFGWIGDKIATVIGAAVGIIGGLVDAIKHAIEWFNSLIEKAKNFADTHGKGGSGSFDPVNVPPLGGGGIPPNYGGKPMPRFAVGTPWFGGGLAMVGERGPELVNLPRGSSVFPTDQSADILRGAKSEEHVHLHVTGPLKVNSEYDVLRQLRRAAAFLPLDARRGTTS